MVFRPTMGNMSLDSSPRPLRFLSIQITHPEDDSAGLLASGVWGSQLRRLEATEGGCQRVGGESTVCKELRVTEEAPAVD